MARVILHVDDDRKLPPGVVKGLRAEGYEWVHSTDPERVMRVVEQEGPALVLLEVALEACNGIDLLAGIVAGRGSEVPVLVLTHETRDSAMHGEVIALGVSHFLTKPVLPGELLASIREIALPPPERKPKRAPAPKPELEGDLGSTPAPELLARLRRRGAAGVFELRNDDVRIEIELRNGTPICMCSDYGDGPAAALSEDAAEEEIFDTFGWSEGTWRFFGRRHLAPDASTDLSRDPAGLLMCGVLQASPAKSVRERLRKHATLYLSVSADGEEFLEELELSTTQSAQLAEMAGRRSLGEILDAGTFDERMLYGLWVAGRIDLHAVPTLDLTGLEMQLELEPEPEPEPPIEPVYVELREPEPEQEPEPATREPVEAPSPTPEPSEPPRRIERVPSVPDRITAVKPTPQPAPPTNVAPEDLSSALRLLADEMKDRDDFEVLGLDVDASATQLEAAYRERLRDVPEAALESSDYGLRVRAERLRDRVESAYAHLKDPESRRAYTLLRKEEDEEREAGKAAERQLEGERWFRKGKTHLDGSRHDDAAAAFGMASHLDPDEGEYLAHLGYALFLSKPDNRIVQREAMEHVANGIKQSPTRAMSYLYLGRMLKARGEHPAALKVFRRALRLKPDCHPAQHEIRLLEAQEKKGSGLLSRILRKGD